MAEVNVRVLGLLAPDQRERIRIKAKTVGDALDKLIKRYGEGFARLLLDRSTGGLRRSIAVYVNGQNIQGLEGTDTELKDGDDVAVIPVMGGGSN